MLRLTIAMSAVLALCACGTTYTRNTGSIVSVNVSTVSGDKAKDQFVVVIDDSIKNAKRENFKTNSHICSAHTLNLDAGDTLRSALQAATRELIEDVVEAKSLPANSANSISFRLDEFNPRISCQIGPTEGVCSATTEVGVSVVANVQGKRRTFSASSQRSADGPAGALCDKALNVAEEATRKAAKDVAERIGERLAVVIANGK